MALLHPPGVRGLMLRWLGARGARFRPREPSRRAAPAGFSGEASMSPSCPSSTTYACGGGPAVQTQAWRVEEEPRRAQPELLPETSQRAALARPRLQDLAQRLLVHCPALHPQRLGFDALLQGGRAAGPRQGGNGRRSPQRNHAAKHQRTARLCPGYCPASPAPTCSAASLASTRPSPLMSAALRSLSCHQCSRRASSASLMPSRLNRLVAAGGGRAQERR